MGLQNVYLKFYIYILWVVDKHLTTLEQTHNSNMITVDTKTNDIFFYFFNTHTNNALETLLKIKRKYVHTYFWIIKIWLYSHWYTPSKRLYIFSNQ